MINIQTMINQAVEANNRVKAHGRNPKLFHMSDAGTCHRKRYLKRLGAKQRIIPTPNLRKMLAGDAGHQMLQSILSASGSLFTHENTIRVGDDILGHYDGIVKDGESKSVLEIKTIEKFQMGYIKQDGPKPEHLTQMFTYWNYLRPDYTNLDQAILAYVKREDFEVVSFNYMWDADVESRVDEDWAPLLISWKLQHLPDCTCNLDYGGKGVNYCPFQSDDGESCCSADLVNQTTTEVEV